MLEYIIGFVMGIVVTWFLNYIMALGHSINVLKSTQRSCAALFITCEQGLQEILYIKYLTMEETGRSQQNVTSQKYIDQMNIESVKKSIMRNYNSMYPSSYEHIKEYSSWEDMEAWVTKEIKQGKKIS